MLQKIFYATAGGFAGGVFIRSFFDFEYLWLLGILLGGAFVAAALMEPQKFKAHFLLALLFVSVSLGVLRFELSNPSYEKHLLDDFLEERVEARGIIDAEPDVRETNQKFSVALETLEGAATSARVLATAPLRPSYSYGDEIVLRGALQKPGTVAENGREFDYAAYLAKENIRYTFLFPQIEKEGEGKGNGLVRALLSLKRVFLEKTQEVIPEPAHALGAGLVLGAKQSLGEEWLARFRVSGLIHIVVLSGYNVTLVGDFIQKIFSALPQALSVSLGALGIIAFAVITGASETTVRASIMALLVIFARMIRRDYVIGRALLIAGTLMLIHNPNILVFDTSFQLSFLATLGLVYLSPRVERYFLWVPTKLKLRDIVGATVATQIFVLPLLLYTTGLFSLVSLPANLLVLPLVPLTMLTYFLTGFAGFLSPLLSLPFSFVSHGLLSYELFIAEFFASLPLSSFQIESFSAAILVLAYGALAAFVWRLNKRKALA